MKDLEGIQAVVTGGASGIGRAAVDALLAAGAKVRVVERDAGKLAALQRELNGAVEIVQGDISELSVVERAMGERTPELLVLSASQRPAHAAIHEHTWESFSAHWHNDVRSTFFFGQEAIRRPLRPGSTVVIMSSGAALGGSPLSGGYGGAKWTQRLMAGYLQGVSDDKKLGIRFVALLPKQMVAGTEVANRASARYAAKLGITQEKFMERFGKPLTAPMVAQAILALGRGEGPAGPAVVITGNSGMEALAAP